ncbi:MAG: N-acetylmuramoyl-L-alanine amidase [Armatimonadetes bacterium]|nr:N-acetylmuramoyl-L-alanine amidase [Armatimonadota bacterium]
MYYDHAGSLSGANLAAAVDAPAALMLLPYPPAGLTSALPPETRLLAYAAKGQTITVDFSQELIGTGLDDARLEAIYHQVKMTLEAHGIQESVRILANGRDLYTWTPAQSPITPRTRALEPQGVELQATGNKLAGKRISLSPGHGLKWGGSGWSTDRPPYCSPLNEEDYHTLEMSIYLLSYLQSDGADVIPNRCMDKSYGVYAVSGAQWWRMGPSYWLQSRGYPCSVYANSTGDCVLGSGASESNDNIRARGLMPNYDGADLHIAVHTNGLSGFCEGAGCPTGVATYYDNSASHTAWGAISKTLALKVQSAVVSTIRTNYDATWSDRGVPDFNGGNYETRIPECAAALVELGFHDTCDRDAVFLRDNYFRSAGMWGIYKGICDYYGVQPTWAFQSDEIVSHDIPTQMLPGEVRQVHLSFRNRGVLWTSARNYRLGAWGDSDPLSSQTRFELPGEVSPGDTVTFAITLKAPLTPGTYRTDWRMLQENVAWFGPTIEQDVVVAPESNPPAISNVEVLPSLVAANDALQISATVADTSGVVSVKANGVSLSPSGGTVWAGAINADSEIGSHPVTIEATDGVGNVGADTSGSYVTGPVYRLNNFNLRNDELVPTAATHALFGTWGRVHVINGDTFELDDGSEQPVRVSLPGHLFQNGDFVFARGVLNPSTRSLTTQPGQALKLD